MNRKQEIWNDIFNILRKVYNIHPGCDRSEKQEQFITEVVEYIELNLGTRRKRLVDDKELEECSKKSPST